MRKILTLLVTAAGLLAAETAPAPAGDVIGPGNFIHVIGDVVKSLQFYHDVLGMEMQGPPGTKVDMPRPYGSPLEIVNLYNAIGGQFRVGNAMVPDSPMRAELVEWNRVDRKPVQPRYQDPGAATMVLGVRGLDSVMARVKQSGATIVTSGGEPVAIPEGKAVLLRDPDGFYVELIQRTAEASAPAAGASNFIDVGFMFTVSDTDRMVHVFKDGLGFEPATGKFQSDKARLKLMGMKGAKYRETTALVPGSAFHVSFLQFKGIDTHAAVQSRPQDPGSPVLRLRVRDVDATMKKLNGVGVQAASHGGEFVTLKNPVNTQRAAIMSAPDDLFIQVIQVVTNP